MPLTPLVKVNPNSLYVFVGYPGHGKTTARRMFCELTGLKGGSCSDVIFEVLSAHTGDDRQSWEIQKQTDRDSLVKLGDFLCGHLDRLTLWWRRPGEKVPTSVEIQSPFERGPAALALRLYDQGVRAIDGVRRASEMHALRAEMDKRGVTLCVVLVTSLWNRETPPDNTDPEVLRFAPWVIVNDRSLRELEARVGEWARWCAAYGGA